MDQRPCVFCQIVGGAIPAKIVYQDQSSLAFLDVNPRSKGMTIVIPRQHYKQFDENLDSSFKTFSSALVVAEMVKQALQPKEINFSIINSEMVPHFHIRIYPVYEKEMPLMENQSIQIDESELESIAQKIRSVKIEFKKEEKVEEVKKEEEKPVEKERSKEETYWIKRNIDLA